MRALVRLAGAALAGALATTDRHAQAPASVPVPAQAAPAMPQPASPAAPAHPTFDAVRARGHLVRGVVGGFPGFAAVDARGTWTGLDIDLCRAVAAAIFGDASRVRYTELAPQQPWAALAAGDVDLLPRGATITYARDVALAVDFAGIIFFDGQGFMLRRASGMDTLRQLDGATICVACGSTEERQVQDYFHAHDMRLTATGFARSADALAAYDAEQCDAYTASISALAVLRQRLGAPDQHVILPQTIANDPQGPAVRRGDAHWLRLVRWVLNGMIAAEALGVTSQNVEQMRTTSRNAEVRRMLGTEGNLGQLLGLSADWLAGAIRQVGNYGESFARNVGSGSPLRLERGRSQPWTHGGIFYAPPFQ